MSLLPCILTPLLTDNLLVPAKFPSSRKNVQCLGVGRATIQQRLSLSAGRRHNHRHEMLAEYLERALSLERLAADEQDATFKARC